MGKKGYDTIVIGAGASGMMAAVTAARRGMSVLILEQLSEPGKKLLATGNGKCNYTNERVTAECYRGNRRLVEAVLSRFSRDESLAFFHELGILPKNKRGCYYPNSEQASSVRDALTAELKRLGVALETGARLLSARPDAQGWLCRTEGRSWRGRNVIFATGLTASPRLGSDGSAIPVIKELGHRFVPILPALCGFSCEGINFKRVSGVRCDALLRLEIDGAPADEERGELQLTDYGLSGIPMFQLASEAARALYDRKMVRVHIDFLPELDERELADELAYRRGQDRGTAAEALAGLLNGKLIPEFFAAADIDKSRRMAALSDEELRRLSAAIRTCSVRVKESRGMEHAQVCAGGIRTEELNVKTLESRLHPGLYFAGELLDADGICGGYNLQWAWSTGCVAGSSVT